MTTRISYQELFSLQCLHSYFSDGICHALSLWPTDECERLLRRYRLLYRPSRGGGTIYRGVQAGLEPLRDFAETTPFSFLLVCTDPLLGIYTDIDVSQAAPATDRVHYFSNRDSNQAHIDGQRVQLLHASGKPLQQPPLTLIPSQYTYRFDAPVRSATLQVLSDPLLSKLVWQQQTPAQQVSAWPIDLRGQLCGRYQLYVDGAVPQDCYLHDGRNARLWGMAEIFAGGRALAKHIPSDCQIVDASGQILPRKFVIAFAARATMWRYYIFDPSQQRSTQQESEVLGLLRGAAVSIAAGADAAGAGDAGARQIQFTRKPGLVTLAGRQAIVFESQQRVALCQAPMDGSHVFTFKANGSGARAVSLPIACPSATSLDAAADGVRLCSEIFVYL
jgi:hypothetical protein